jgi:hypothetical protein
MEAPSWLDTPVVYGSAGRNDSYTTRNSTAATTVSTNQGSGSSSHGQHSRTNDGKNPNNTTTTTTTTTTRRAGRNVLDQGLAGLYVSGPRFLSAVASALPHTTVNGAQLASLTVNLTNEIERFQFASTATNAQVRRRKKQEQLRNQTTRASGKKRQRPGVFTLGIEDASAPDPTPSGLGIHKETPGTRIECSFQVRSMFYPSGEPARPFRAKIKGVDGKTYQFTAKAFDRALISYSGQADSVTDKWGETFVVHRALPQAIALTVDGFRDFAMEIAKRVKVRSGSLTTKLLQSMEHADAWAMVSAMRKGLPYESPQRQCDGSYYQDASSKGGEGGGRGDSANMEDGEEVDADDDEDRPGPFVLEDGVISSWFLASGFWQTHSHLLGLGSGAGTGSGAAGRKRGRAVQARLGTRSLGTLDRRHQRRDEFDLEAYLETTPLGRIILDADWMADFLVTRSQSVLLDLFPLSALTSLSHRERGDLVKAVRTRPFLLFFKPTTVRAIRSAWWHEETRFHADRHNTIVDHGECNGVGSAPGPPAGEDPVTWAGEGGIESMRPTRISHQQACVEEQSMTDAGCCRAEFTLPSIARMLAVPTELDTDDTCCSRRVAGWGWGGKLGRSNDVGIAAEEEEEEKAEAKQKEQKEGHEPEHDRSDETESTWTKVPQAGCDHLHYLPTRCDVVLHPERPTLDMRSILSLHENGSSAAGVIKNALTEEQFVLVWFYALMQFDSEKTGNTLFVVNRGRGGGVNKVNAALAAGEPVPVSEMTVLLKNHKKWMHRDSQKPQFAKSWDVTRLGWMHEDLFRTVYGAQLGQDLPSHHHNVLVNLARLGVVVFRPTLQHSPTGQYDFVREIVCSLQDRWVTAIRGTRLLEYIVVRNLLNQCNANEIMDPSTVRGESTDQFLDRLDRLRDRVTKVPAVEALDQVETEALLAPLLRKVPRKCLDPQQQVAYMTMQLPVSMYLGRAGRGKTTVVGHMRHDTPELIVRGPGGSTVLAQAPRVRMVAPTCRLRDDMAKRYGQAETSAYLRQYGRYNNERLRMSGRMTGDRPTIEARQSEVRIGVGDEAGILDTQGGVHLLELMAASPKMAALVLIADPSQMGPVSPGGVLGEFANAPEISVVQCCTEHRTAEARVLGSVAERIAQIGDAFAPTRVPTPHLNNVASIVQLVQKLLAGNLYDPLHNRYIRGDWSPFGTDLEARARRCLLELETRVRKIQRLVKSSPEHLLALSKPYIMSEAAARSEAKSLVRSILEDASAARARGHEPEVDLRRFDPVADIRTICRIQRQDPASLQVMASTHKTNSNINSKVAVFEGWQKPGTRSAPVFLEVGMKKRCRSKITIGDIVIPRNMPLAVVQIYHSPGGDTSMPRFEPPIGNNDRRVQQRKCTEAHTSTRQQEPMNRRRAGGQVGKGKGQPQPPGERGVVEMVVFLLLDDTHAAQKTYLHLPVTPELVNSIEDGTAGTVYSYQGTDVPRVWLPLDEGRNRALYTGTTRGCKQCIYLSSSEFSHATKSSDPAAALERQILRVEQPRLTMLGWCLSNRMAFDPVCFWTAFTHTDVAAIEELGRRRVEASEAHRRSDSQKMQEYHNLMRMWTKKQKAHAKAKSDSRLAISSTFTLGSTLGTPPTRPTVASADALDDLVLGEGSPNERRVARPWLVYQHPRCHAYAMSRVSGSQIEGRPVSGWGLTSPLVPLLSVEVEAMEEKERNGTSGVPAVKRGLTNRFESTPSQPDNVNLDWLTLTPYKTPDSVSTPLDGRGMSSNVTTQDAAVDDGGRDIQCDEDENDDAGSAERRGPVFSNTRATEQVGGFEDIFGV